MSWYIEDKRLPSPNSIDFIGNKFLIGNGYLGYRGTLDEYLSKQKTGVLIAGLYDQVPGKWREPVNAPNACFFCLEYMDRKIDVLKSKVKYHRQSLNIKHAIHKRETVFSLENNLEVIIKSKRFASINNPHLICLEYSFSANKNINIVCKTGILGTVWDLNGPHLKDFKYTAENNYADLYCVTKEKNNILAVSTSLESENEPISICEELPDFYQNITINAQPGITSELVA